MFKSNTSLTTQGETEAQQECAIPEAAQQASPGTQVSNILQSCWPHNTSSRHSNEAHIWMFPSVQIEPSPGRKPPMGPSVELQASWPFSIQLSPFHVLPTHPPPPTTPAFSHLWSRLCLPWPLYTIFLCVPPWLWSGFASNCQHLLLLLKDCSTGIGFAPRAWRPDMSGNFYPSLGTGTPMSVCERRRTMSQSGHVRKYN